MRITFDPGARADLDDIFAWIATPHLPGSPRPILRGKKPADRWTR